MNKGLKVQGNYQAYLDLTLAMFISGSAVVVSKMMVNSLPTYLATELGIAIGMLILLPYTFLIKKCDWRYDFRTNCIMLAQAACGIFLYRIFTFIGLKYTTAGSSGLITSAGPVMVLVLAYVLLKEKIFIRQVLAIISTVIGLVLINLAAYSGTDGRGSIKGNILIILAVICEALFSILSKAKCKPISPLCRTTIIVIYAFALLLPFCLYDAFRYDFSKIDLKAVLCVLYYGTFVTFLSYILWFRGIEKIKAGSAAVFTSVVPISSVTLSVIFLKEKLLPLHLVSMVFIIGGIWISVSKKNKLKAIRNNMRKVKPMYLITNIAFQIHIS